MSRANDTISDSELGRTYMDLLLSGEKLPGDIDDFVESWHDAADESTAASLTLAEYLGMTENEYQLWVEQPYSVGFIAAAHKTRQPVEQLLASRDQLGGMLGKEKRAQDESQALAVLEQRFTSDPGLQ